MSQKHLQPIPIGGNWALAAKHLTAEALKVCLYDDTLFSKLGPLTGKQVLDYGSGPGVFASRLGAAGATIHAFDTSRQMRNLAAERIGQSQVYDSVDAIPRGRFDIIVCNLVVCIVDEIETARILRTLRMLLTEQGRVFVGFCNPHIFDVPESLFDTRHPTGASYGTVHEYAKIKHEGRHLIIERHRPIEWYTTEFADAGLRVVETTFTPTYEKLGRHINDFVIFTLTKCDTT